MNIKEEIMDSKAKNEELKSLITGGMGIGGLTLPFLGMILAVPVALYISPTAAVIECILSPVIGSVIGGLLSYKAYS